MEGEIYQQGEDESSRSVAASMDADHPTSTPRPQSRQSKSIKPEEELKFLNPNPRKRLQRFKQAYILKSLDKLKDSLYPSEAGNHFESQQRGDRIDDIEMMKREFTTLIEDDVDVDDEDEANLRKGKQHCIRQVLNVFETEITGGGTGLWRQETGLQAVKRLKQEFKNLVHDERERSTASMGGSVASSEIISLDE